MLYLFEHPRTATSWKLPRIRRMMKRPDTIEVLSNMCRFGMATERKGEEGLVSKATRFLPDSPEVAKRLNKRCDEECRKTRRIAVWGSRAKDAQYDPPGLCRAVAEGVEAQR